MVELRRYISISQYRQFQLFLSQTILRLFTILPISLVIAPAYSKVRYRGSTFGPFVRPFVRPSVRPQFMSMCLLCGSDSWEYETLHSNYP